jgi:hypothetical protein
MFPRLIAAIFLFTAPVSAVIAQPVRHLPVLESEIRGNISIGVERSGQLSELVTTQESSSRTTSGSLEVTTTDLKVRNVELTKTKSTNPNKQKSKPKAGGLFGGIARAFTGDYTGLIEWGGAFADHMAEPKFDRTVVKTYHTKDNRETRTVNTSLSKWEDTSSFESTITRQFTTHIDKGFIRFALQLRNLSDRSVTLASPSLVLLFEEADGSETPFADTVPSTPEFTIPAGGSYVLPVTIKNLDFLELSRRYRNATGILVEVQNFQMRVDGAFRPVAALHDQYRDSRIRFEYFNGTSRLVRYIQVPAEGIAAEDFIRLALADFNPELADPGPDEHIDSMVRRIGTLRSSQERYDALPAEQRATWARWFLSAHDVTGAPIDPLAQERLHPGYYVQLGYYTAADVAPMEFKPLIWESRLLSLVPNGRIHIPVDLKAGDIISFEDLVVDDYLVPEITFSLAKASQLCPYSTVWPEPDYTHGATSPPFHVTRITSGCWRVAPVSASVKSVDPRTLIFGSNGQPEPGVPSELASYMLAQPTIASLSRTFFRVDDIQYVRTGLAGAAINPIVMPSEEFDRHRTVLGLQFRPGERSSDLIRRELQRSGALMFVVERDTSRTDSHWTFFQPKRTLRPMLAAGGTGPETPDPGTSLKAQLLNNGFSSRVYKLCDGYICDWLKGIPYPENITVGPNPLGGMRFLRPDGTPSRFAPGMARLEGDGSALEVPNSFGPQIKARIRVFRYTRPN